jgi:hypothetical protein
VAEKVKRNGLRYEPFWPYSEDPERLVGINEARRAQLRDLALVYQLLCGMAMVDEGGKCRMLKRIQPGGEQERESRRALARMLRQGMPLDRFVCNHLADLLDPDNNSTQELVLRTRAAGHSQDYLRDVHVGAGMADDVASGASVKIAIDNAVWLFGISTATAHRIWAKYGKVRFAIMRTLKETPESQIAG